MRTEDLRLFLAVTRHRSLHQTAATLGMTQSALSKALARLEGDTGMPVFERTSRGVALTCAGQRLVEHARKVTLAFDDMENELNDQRAARAGKVRLATFPHLVSSFAPLLAQFFVRRPLATFSIETDLSQGLLEALQSGDVDLICTSAPNAVPPGISWCPWGAVNLRIVTRIGHPRRASFRSLADLAGERWALPGTSLTVRQYLEEKFLALGLPSPCVAVESSSPPSDFAELLRSSDLLGLMPSQFINQPGGQGLTVIEGAGMGWQHELAVMWRTGAYLSPLCQDFREAMLLFGKSE